MSNDQQNQVADPANTKKQGDEVHSHGFTLKKLFPGYIIGSLGITIILLLVLPILLTLPAWWRAADFSKTGDIGDTIGGITAPIIGLLSTVLLFITIRLQWIGLMEERRHRQEDAVESEKRHREVQDLIDIKYILERITELDVEASGFANIVGGLRTYPPNENDSRIATLTLWALEVKFIMDWISRIKTDTSMVRRKLGINYRFKYQEHIMNLRRQILELITTPSANDVAYTELALALQNIEPLSDAKLY